jgi:1,4-dihydroxy-2-naphthoyl-CoA hydrolase
MYSIETSVKLHHTDAAGLLFFGHQFALAHDCYELFLASHGISFLTVLRDRDYLLPIVHAESDYFAALSVGDMLTIDLHCSRLGETSFTLAFDIKRGSEVVGKVSTVHVCTDTHTDSKRPLPDEIRLAFKPHLSDR